MYTGLCCDCDVNDVIINVRVVQPSFGSHVLYLFRYPRTCSWELQVIQCFLSAEPDTQSRLVKSIVSISRVINSFCYLSPKDTQSRDSAQVKPAWQRGYKKGAKFAPELHVQ